VLTPEVGTFKVNVAVLNEGPNTMYLGGCGPEAQRQINNQWSTVWSPICVGSLGRTAIAAGDSLKFPVVVYGFRQPNREPALDARVQAGKYRLRFGLATGGAQGTDPGELIFRPSTTFTVVDTTTH
jgi:hypothetical protein